MKFLLCCLFSLIIIHSALAQNDKAKLKEAETSDSVKLKEVEASDKLKLKEVKVSDTVKLTEVEVIGIRPDISTQAPNPVQVMTSKKLDALPTASVAEAIRSFSGVVIKDYGGIGGLKTVMIRSMGANHTAVFVDGLPQIDASTGQTDLGRIPLQSIGNIELSVGQTAFNLKPARMYASASIVNITSIQHDFTKESDYLGLYFKGGSFGSVNPILSYDRKINGAITTGLRLNYYNSNGKYPYQYKNGILTDKLKRTNSDVESIDGNFRTDVRFNDSSSINVKASWYNSERGLPGAVILYNPHSSQRLHNRDLIAGIQYKNNPKKAIREMLTAGFSDSHLIYSDPDFLNQSGGLRNVYNQQEYYISNALANTLRGNFTISLSTDLIYNGLKTNAYSIESPSRISSLTAISTSWQLKKTEIQGSLLLTAAIDKTKEMKGTEYIKLSPAFSIIRTLMNDQSLKARFMYKSTYRMPTFNDLYYTISGNNDLLPEDASLFNLGLIYSKGINTTTSLNMRADAFYNIVKNKIVTVPTRNLFIWSTKNVGKVDIKGIELFSGITHSFNKDFAFDLSASYTYQEARNTTDKSDEYYRNQITYIPFETAGIIGILYYKLYSVGVNHLYNGYRYTAASNDNNSILPAWNTTDLTLARKWIYRENKFELKLEVSNIANEQYEVIKGFPMVGRSFFFTISATI